MIRINSSSERPHRSSSCNISSNSGTNTTSELFICFTSRLSSSSMKISSKSILSPGHSRESSQISLSTSLSRRLRNSGSLKGGGGHASPMFPTGSKKRGCSFENPEPSSPKVTCIGQIRVKTKKQGKKMRTRSKRMGSSEASFRRPWNQNPNDPFGREQQAHQNFHLQNPQQECSPHRNQRWVHLPLTICEALRAFGSEFNCFLPCRSSCMTSEREKEEKADRSDKSSSCGAVFGRWLVAVEDGDGKEREIELVVGGGENGSQRRKVFDGIEFKEEEKSETVEEEEAARVSICIPPKNALLLMRCRSDPVKMAALANRFWDSPAPKLEDDLEEEDEDNEDEQSEAVRDGVKNELQMELNEDEQRAKWVSDTEEDQPQDGKESLVLQKEEDVAEAPEGNQEVEKIEEESPLNNEKPEDEELEEMAKQTEEEQILDANKPALVEEIAGNSISAEQNTDPENIPYLILDVKSDHGQEAEDQEQIEEDGDGDERGFLGIGQELEPETKEGKAEEDEEAESESSNEVTERSTVAIETRERSWEDEKKTTHERSESEDPKDEVGPVESKGQDESQQPKPRSILPDCLLLMMCEPKLSMEVSKETWVCSTDFIRRLPEKEKKKKKPVEKTNSSDEPIKRVSMGRNSDASRQHLLQPPRSSCSFPAMVARGAGESMATMIEQKLINGKAYEPFALTRCKSEPRRSSAKLATEACFWKNRKLEPQQHPATLGVGF